MAAHRYWRILSTTTQSATDISLQEIELRESVGGADATGSGAAAAARELLGFEASKAFDNNAGTAWAAKLRAGTYASGLSPPGPDTLGEPLTVDANGDTTINGLINAAGTGATVTIPGGITYIINAPITPLNGQTLQAAPGTAVTLKAADGLGAVNMFSLVFVTGATVKNLTIDGNYATRAAQEGANNAETIIISGGGTLTFLNCAINNSPSTAIWSFNCAGLSIRLCTGHENYQAVRIDGASLPDAVLIEGNVFTNTAAVKSVQGVEVLSTNNLTIRANTLGGFGLQEPTSHGFEGTWGNTIFLTGSDTYLIENNDCSAVSYWSSIVLGAGATNGKVQYNNLGRGSTGTQSLWYEQSGADILLVTLNVMDGGSSIGDGGGDHLTFTFNTVTGDAVGIDLNSGCTVAVITDNTFTCRPGVAAALNGIFLWDKSTAGDSVAYQRNVLTDYLTAVDINNPGGTGTVFGLNVTGNTFVNCTNGIVLEGSVTADASCTLQGASVAPTPWFPYISYDFGAGVTKNIVQVQLTSWLATQFLGLWLFQFSDDGAAWTTQWTIHDTPLADGTSRLYTGDVAAFVSTLVGLGMRIGLGL